MRKIDIFVSSPPDVQAERSVVERLVRSIAIEFNLPVTFTYSNRLRKSKPSDKIAGRAADGLEEGRPLLCPLIWEYADFEPEQDNGERIPNTGQYDLVVCILWSRLGTKISPSFVMPDASRPTSATEYEIASALDQVKRTPGFPELHLYRNLTVPAVPLEPKEEREIFCQRWDALQQFFSTWKSNRAFSGICSEYQDLREFEDLFRKHFRDFVLKQLHREIVPGKAASNRHYWKQNPFRGLELFNFEHAAIFQGRTKAIGEVLVTLKKQASAGHPFVLVIGPNGSGKSSLVRAGVLPILTEPGSTGGPWRRATARPGVGGARGDPFKRLAAALLAEAALPELSDAEAPNGEENLASELGDNPQGVARRVADLLVRAGLQELNRVAHEEKKECERGGRIEDSELAKYRRLTRIIPEAHLALIIDPLDDLFTGGFSPEIQRRYIEALVTLIRSKRVFVIATLRSAFYAAYQQFPELIELTGTSGKYDLAPPTPEEIGNMIRLPAEAAGLRFEQGLAESYGLDQTIFDAAMASTEPLPLLEHVLSELYRKQARRNDGLLRFSDYFALGELKGALGNHAETIFSMLMNDAQGAFASVMRRLVWFGDEGQGIGRMALYKEVASPTELKSRQKEGAKFLVDYFIKEGLFHADSDQTPERIVCISHQALLQKWPRVLQWLSENQAFLRMRDRLDAILNPTVRRDGRRENLFGPSFGVADAQMLLRHFRSSLSKTQIEYLKKNLAKRKRAGRIRDGTWAAAGSGIMVLAAIGGIQWYAAEIEKESAVALTGLERRVDENTGGSRHAQDREPKRLKDDSQTEQMNTEFASDGTREPGDGLQMASVQQVAQDHKGQTNQLGAKDGARASLVANSASDEQQLKKFVADYLQAVASDDISSQNRFFARRVDYLDQGVISLSQVQAALERYNREWPKREWKPQGEAGIHNTNGSKLYEILQPYTWTNSDGSRQDQGSGTLYLRLYKSSTGDFHIVHVERRD